MDDTPQAVAEATETRQANFHLPVPMIDWLKDQALARTRASGGRVTQTDIVREALAAAGAPGA